MGSGLVGAGTVGGTGNSAIAMVSNPVVPLLYSTNVRCSNCTSSYCLICQQGGSTPAAPCNGSIIRYPQQQLHVPASCAQYAQWMHKITTGESETANWLLLNTKPCPGPVCSANNNSNNSTRIEKNQGILYCLLDGMCWINYDCVCIYLLEFICMCICLYLYK